MATNKAKRHVHKYHKVIVGGTKVWACAHPECPHFMPAHMAEMVAGKASYCWECGEKMILDADNMKMDKPTCPECRGLADIDIDAILEERMNQVK